MEPWYEAGQDILIFAGLLLLNVYLSLALVNSVGHSVTGLPRPVLHLVEGWRHEGHKVGTFSLAVLVALLCFIQVLGLVSLWPWANVSPVERICAVAFLLAEAVWFTYVHRHLVRAGGD